MSEKQVTFKGLPAISPPKPIPQKTPPPPKQRPGTGRGASLIPQVAQAAPDIDPVTLAHTSSDGTVTSIGDLMKETASIQDTTPGGTNKTGQRAQQSEAYQRAQAARDEAGAAAAEEKFGGAVKRNGGDDDDCKQSFRFLMNEGESPADEITKAMRQTDPLLGVNRPKNLNKLLSLIDKYPKFYIFFTLFFFFLGVALLSLSSQKCVCKCDCDCAEIGKSEPFCTGCNVKSHTESEIDVFPKKSKEWNSYIGFGVVFFINWFGIRFVWNIK